MTPLSPVTLAALCRASAPAPSDPARRARWRSCSWRARRRRRPTRASAPAHVPGCARPRSAWPARRRCAAAARCPARDLTGGGGACVRASNGSRRAEVARAMPHNLISKLTYSRAFRWVCAAARQGGRRAAGRRGGRGGGAAPGAAAAAAQPAPAQGAEPGQSRLPPARAALCTSPHVKRDRRISASASCDSCPSLPLHRLLYYLVHLLQIIAKQ